LNFLHRFSKKAQLSIFIKILSLEAELFHADGQTEGEADGKADGETGHVTKLTVGVRNSANAPKNGCNIVLWKQQR
jgi:hypothetical protein